MAAADRFIKLHPNHPNVDYAYYLKGLVNFNERGIVEKLTSSKSTIATLNRYANRSSPSRNW